MAEEAAQEHPGPSAPRPVRCIVKLGTVSRCPPRHASFPCVPVRLSGTERWGWAGRRRSSLCRRPPDTPWNDGCRMVTEVLSK